MVSVAIRARAAAASTVPARHRGSITLKDKRYAK